MTFRSKKEQTPRHKPARVSPGALLLSARRAELARIQARRVRASRALAGMNQAALAERLEVLRQHLGAIESGRVALAPEMAEAMAKHLAAEGVNVSPAWLLGIAGDDAGGGHAG